MRAYGYLQVTAERRADGQARGLRIARVTAGVPRDPLPGALIVKVALDVPDEWANIQTVEAAADIGLATLVLEPYEAVA